MMLQPKLRLFSWAAQQQALDGVEELVDLAKVLEQRLVGWCRCLQCRLGAHAREHLTPGATPVDVLKHGTAPVPVRSEEHTSELQSLRHLVCRLLLEKKKKK